MKIFNTLTRKLEPIGTEGKKSVSMYNCGPTVYMPMHIGNLRAYAFVDVLRRTLEYLGFDVEQVMNLTDVGHLVSDEDAGQDKLEKSAQKENKDPWQIAEHYIETVKNDFKEMNFLTPKNWVRATNHIEEMINLVKSIEDNGYAYETDLAVYFDVSKLDNYGILQGGQKLEDKKVAVREEINVDPDKKNPADFVLWVKAVGEHANHIMRWDSPWGVGFPGWHIECSAMGTKYLGEYIDIHTGGEDHISIHHPNEMAQNFGAFKHQVVEKWVHNKFLNIDGGKMSKSLGNVYTLQDVKEKGFDPMDLRYFFLMANYRTNQNFTWENLEMARVARKKMGDRISRLNSGDVSQLDESFKSKFVNALEDDLNLPVALSVVWDLLKSELNDEIKVATLLDFDKVLGLNLNDYLRSRPGECDSEIDDLVKSRNEARLSKDWEKADQIRAKIEELGFEIEDTPDGTIWHVK